ncbi:MAG: CMD domain protein [Bradyrhizobium sp.]|uniref:CMD domain protein n=1 Tax=Bradyrhizobium sp. TaxID=376 RepID=UPI001D71FBD4|nr:CMD domain protein [Bradyrhizobium sp.]MBV9559446.1 CMD domain protein [Bradyrhizobium sp.]
MNHPIEADLIDRLLGITPGSRLDQIRAARPLARENSQKSYLALLQPTGFGGFPARERWAVAAFVASLHGEPATAAFYAAELCACDPALADIVVRAADRVATQGPYGRYPAGPLSAEDAPGPTYRAGDDDRAGLGPHLAAGLAHAHLLIFHPRDAGPDALHARLEAGWSTTDIVTLSQLVAFLSFQIRVVAGLRELAATLQAA